MNENANQILPRLWLGNKASSVDTEFLHTNSITVVFNCTKHLPFSPAITRKYRVPIDDNLEHIEIANLETWAPEIVYKLRKEYNMGRTILIHCHAGMQRSAAVMAMALLVLLGKPLPDIVAYIRSKRPIAFFPRANFFQAMRGFETSWNRAIRV